MVIIISNDDQFVSLKDVILVGFIKNKLSVSKHLYAFITVKIVFIKANIHTSR